MPPLELLAELDIVPPLTPLPVTRDSQSGTSFTSQKDPLTPSPHIGGLILPVSSSIISREPRIHGDQYGRSDGASPCPSEVMIDDPPFTFDENGDFVDLTEANIISETPLRLEEDQMKMHAIESAGVGEEGSDRSWPNTKVSMSARYLILEANQPLIPSHHNDFSLLKGCTYFICLLNYPTLILVARGGANGIRSSFVSVRRNSTYYA